jgi:Arc/MetJ family transcription regulator
MGMTKTPIEIDDELLEQAKQVLGTTTKKDTVNAALREVGQRIKRLQAMEELRAMALRGDFDEFVGNKAAYRDPAEYFRTQPRSEAVTAPAANQAAEADQPQSGEARAVA